MKNVAGYWFPDREERLRAEKLLTQPYQRGKYQSALAYVPEHRRQIAVDVGAHVGLWTRQMQADFEFVVAFEPDPEKHECFFMNVDPDRCQLFKFGLSDSARKAALSHKTGSSLKTHVSTKPGGSGQIALRRLDELGLGVGSIDLLKMDVEGYELFALKGAERTIRSSMPSAIIIEQKPGVASKRYGLGDQDALRLLESWGYAIREELNGDFILTPENRR